MKKLKWFLFVIVVLTLFNSVIVSASELSTREQQMVEAYCKAVETGKVAYISEYVYPDYTYDDTSMNYEFKVLNPTYGKGYDSESGSYYLYFEGLSIAINSSNQYVAFHIKQAISLKEYDRVDYLYTQLEALSSFSQVFKKDMTDSERTLITDYLDKASQNDSTGNTGSTDSTQSETKSTSTKKGSLNNPIEFKKAYTWTDSYDNLGDNISGKFSLKVLKANNITDSQMKKLGLVFKSTDEIQWKLVTVKWVGSNVKIKKIDGNGYIYTCLILPNVFGSETPDNVHIIDYCDYAFTNSLQKNFKSKYGIGTKLKAGKNFNFSVTGNILLATKKGDTNYFTVFNQSISDYTDSKIHFKLK